MIDLKEKDAKIKWCPFRGMAAINLHDKIQTCMTHGCMFWIKNDYRFSEDYGQCCMVIKK